MEIGKNIISYRTKAGLSQEALAKRIGVAKSTVFRWETNATKPSLETALKISKVLGISPELIFLSDKEIKQLKIANSALSTRLKKVEKLSYSDQKALYQIIDAFLKSKKEH